MSSKDLIDLDDIDLIKTILENLKNSGTKVRLWQKLSSIHKVNLAKVDFINFVENKVRLKPFKGREFFLSPTPYVYFHSNHRTTLFKTTILERDAFRLEIKIPKFAKIHEGRREERKSLGEDSSLATIKLDGLGKQIRVKVLDISQRGAALSVPRGLFDLAEVGSFITVISQHVSFLDNKIAVIRNKAAFTPDAKYPNFIRFRLGLEIFSEKDIDEYLKN